MNKNISLTITNIFIILSFIGTIIWEFGLLNYDLSSNIPILLFIKFFIFTFFHGGALHFIFNSIVLYYFGHIVELLLGKTKFIIFFVFSVIFSGLGIYLVTNSYNVIGISGFCMAILSYYTLDLKDKNNPEYKGGITFILINILVGFMPGISLLGHLFGAISGIIFYYINKELFRRKMVGLVK